MLFYDVAWPDWSPRQYSHYPPTADKARINVLYGDGHCASIHYRQLGVPAALGGLDFRVGVDEGDSNFYKTGWRLED
jgi:prepilin-type processing-associated H-X9-DG protein